MVLLLCNISVPPNHNTMTMSIVPRNSLIGCAICWRMLTWLMVLRYRLLDSVKRVFIFFFCVESLDDAQTTECFLQVVTLSHSIVLGR